MSRMDCRTYLMKSEKITSETLERVFAGLRPGIDTWLRKTEPCLVVGWLSGSSLSLDLPVD